MASKRIVSLEIKSGRAGAHTETHPNMSILVRIIAIPLTVDDLIGVSCDRRLLFGHGEGFVGCFGHGKGERETMQLVIELLEGSQRLIQGASTKSEGGFDVELAASRSPRYVIRQNTAW